MKMTQCYELVNTMAKEHLGESAVVAEDLSNIIDLGKAFTSAIGLDNYVKSLNDHVGKMVFVNREYEGRAPSLMVDEWQWGSIVEKVSMELPEAKANASWDLTDQQEYKDNIFYKPTVTATCWNDRVTFEIPMSFTEKQVRSSFSTPTQFNAFVSMIYTQIRNAMNLNLETLRMRTINNLIGETIYADYQSAGLGTKSGIRAVNLLYLYNNRDGSPAAEPLTAAKALHDIEFLAFASKTMMDYQDKLATYSTLFNVAGKDRHTPKDRQHVILLSEFVNAASVYLRSPTFHDEYVKLPQGDTITHWQGTGTDFSFANASKIHETTSGGHAIEVSGVLGCIFDEEAAGVACMDPRVTTHYIASAEFTNEWHKYDAGYWNDTAENAVVFFIQDAA